MGAVTAYEPLPKWRSAARSLEDRPSHPRVPELGRCRMQPQPRPDLKAAEGVKFSLWNCFLIRRLKKLIRAVQTLVQNFAELPSNLLLVAVAHYRLPLAP
jgi:hypothetical protein